MYKLSEHGRASLRFWDGPFGRATSSAIRGFSPHLPPPSTIPGPRSESPSRPSRKAAHDPRTGSDQRKHAHEDVRVPWLDVINADNPSIRPPMILPARSG